MANGHSDFNIKIREEIIESLGAPGIHQLICCINKSMDHHFALTLVAKQAKLSLNKFGVGNRMSPFCFSAIRLILVHMSGAIRPASTSSGR